MSTASRPRGTFGVQKTNIPGVLIRAQAMYDYMTTNAATFVSPTITLVMFLALISALVTAQHNVTSTKAKGLATLRNTKRDGVWTGMESLRTYVQGLADGLNAEAAAALLQSAGMLLALASIRHKAALKATLTMTPGVVHLNANRTLLVGTAGAGTKVTFNWQWSVDGGHTWNDARSTPYAKTDVLGLTLMSAHSFRVSVTIGKDIGAWSQAVGLLVH